ncbi:MAG: PadR family transcriptional regulator [Planctomycetota bacterium]|jgi:PadR family transcriptional regulator PadR
MRVERELMRGAGPVAVLKLLERGEQYGYELVDALARASGGVLAMGQSTLYPLLYNLESKGLIRSRWQDGAAARRRKYYRLTDKGRRRLASERKQWESLARAMEALGVIASAAGVAPRPEGAGA